MCACVCSGGGAREGLGDDVARALARVLPRLPHLESIDVRDNRLGDGAMHALLAAAVALPRLQRLDLSMNEVGAVRAWGASEVVERSTRSARLESRNRETIRRAATWRTDGFCLGTTKRRALE